MTHARYGIAASLIFLLAASLAWLYLNQMPGWRPSGRTPEPQIAFAPAQSDGALIKDQAGAAPVPPPARPVAKTTAAPTVAGSQPPQSGATWEPYVEAGGMLRGPVDSMPPLPAEPVGRDQFAGASDNPFRVVREAPVSTFSIDVDTASYGVVRDALNAGALPPADAVRIEEMVNYFDYAYPLPADRRAPFRASVQVYPTPWNRDTQILHIGIKGFDIPKKERPPANP